MFNMKISDIFGVRELKGVHAGIEVELEWEQGHFPVGFDLGNQWDVHNDGSLVNGVEAVSKPILMGSPQWREAFTGLDRLLNATRPMISERTSIHVHLNASDLTLEETVKGSLGLWLMEGVLLRFCSPSRWNNQFCISVTDTVLMIEEIVRVLKKGVRPILNEENFKYSSLNWARLGDIGTVESRIREGLIRAEDIFEWTEMLIWIFGQGMLAKGSPSDMLRAAGDDPKRFAEWILGPYYKKAIEACRDDGTLSTLVEKNIPLFIPFFSVDWSRDYTVQNKLKKRVKIDLPMVEDDNIFEDDVIVEFDRNAIAPDLDEQEEPFPVPPPAPPPLHPEPLVVMNEIGVIPQAVFDIARRMPAAGDRINLEAAVNPDWAEDPDAFFERLGNPNPPARR